MSYGPAILEIVEASREHLTAEQIFLKMKEKGSGVVLATVYNNLARLHQQGRIRRICVDGFPERYDRIARHDHLVCRRCGSLADVCFPDLTELLQSRTEEKLLNYDLQVSYLCPACRKALTED